MDAADAARLTEAVTDAVADAVKRGESYSSLEDFLTDESVERMTEAVIEEGYLERVDAAYALHCDPSLDVGKVGLRGGATGDVQIAAECHVVVSEHPGTDDRSLRHGDALIGDC